jgi:hypothetical protein
MDARVWARIRTFSLSALNQSLASPLISRLLMAVVFLCALLAFVLPPVQQGRWGVPTPQGDGPDYDNIAIQLVKGNGFSFNWDDRDFLKAYEPINASGLYDYLKQRHGSYPTTYRPPLLPLLMALSYKIFGWGFSPIQAMNCILMAGTCAFAFLLACRYFGPFPGLICAVRYMMDSRIQQNSTSILAESLACFLAILFIWSLLYTVEKKTWVWAFTSGVTLSLAYFSKSLFFLWSPAIFLAIYLLAKPEKSSYLSLASLRLPAIFLASFILCCSPWMIRNCIILERFEPLGTQGSTNLPACFSDGAIRTHGQWYNPDLTDFYHDLPLTKEMSLQNEKLKSTYGKEQGMNWIKNNIDKLPILTFYKLKGEWKPYGMITLTLCLIGLLVFSAVNLLDALALIAIFLAASTPLAICISGDGRYLISLFSLLTALSSLGIWFIIVTCLDPPLDKLKIP